MTMPDDFNPNAPEPAERCCPECGFDPDDQKKLEDALRALIRAWDNPGAMGTMYQMPQEGTMKFHDEMMARDPVYAAAYNLELAAERARDWETASVAARVRSIRNPLTFADAVAAALPTMPRPLNR